MEFTQAGRYELRSLLGKGGGGAVYAGWDPLIGREVAVKLVPLGEIAGQDAMAWALREAQAAGVLSHPHIVTVHDIGALEGYAYIVMELVRGTNLAALLKQHPPAARHVLGVLRQAAEALDFAHSRGIVHRDVKPANILIREDGCAKIGDFGIARIQSAAKLTRTGQFFGTPQYMSPEQIQGKAVDGRSDQFSLAVVAYEALTGRSPYTEEGLVFQILTAPPPPADARWDPVFRKGLAKKPEERFASCTELVDALEQAFASAPAPASPASEPRKALAAAGIAALLALAVGGSWWLTRPRPRGEAGAVPAAVRTGEPPAAGPAAAASAPAPASTPKPARDMPPRPTPPPPEPRPEAAEEPKVASPPPFSRETDVPARTAIWSGSLAPGAELTFGAAGPSAGALTVELPSAFLVDRVTPKVAEVIESPSAANDWSRLRIRNSGSQTLDLVTIRFRPRP